MAAILVAIASLSLAGCGPDDTGASTPPDGPVPSQNAQRPDDNPSPRAAPPTRDNKDEERKVIGVVYPVDRKTSKLPDGGTLTVITRTLEDFPANPKVIAEFTITVRSRGEGAGTLVTIVDFDVEMRRSVPGLKRAEWKPVFIQLDVRGERGLHVHREEVLRQDSDFKVKFREIGVTALNRVHVDFTVRPQGFDTLQYSDYIGAKL